MPRKRNNLPPQTAAIDVKESNRYRAQDALRTLARADEIRRDKGLMREVKAEAKTQMKVTQRVLGGTTPKRGHGDGNG